MNEQEHKDARRWTLQALEMIDKYIDDSDCRVNGNEDLKKSVESQRQQVEHGKYLVTFLGAFNVGKSTLINAFLGDGYLPWIMEECTSALTLIRTSGSTEIRLRLTDFPGNKELKELASAASCEISGVYKNQGLFLVSIKPSQESAESVCKVLATLVTVQADHDFPGLKGLRAKLVEVDLGLPNDLLAEDIQLIDSPGVHSISETRERIAYAIIPRSQLVIQLVNADMAGSVHDLKFIKRIVQYQKRKVFYLINKSDKLNPDEIDVQGRRGPAKDLLNSLRGVDDNAEVFFVSALYALRSQQLSSGKVKAEDIDKDNRVRIPRQVWKLADENPKQLAEYLMETSGFPRLKNRLADYLLNENKEKAIVESACTFIALTADQMAAPMRAELAVAKDPDEIDRLKHRMKHINAEKKSIREGAEELLNKYNVQAHGGRFDNEVFPGFERTLKDMFENNNIEKYVIQPMIEWLKDDGILKEVKKSRKQEFPKLKLEFQEKLDAFVSQVMEQVSNEVGQAENTVANQLARLMEKLEGLRPGSFERPGFKADSESAGVAGHYAVYILGAGAGGAAAGALIGAALFSWSGPGAAIGAGVGALVGLAAGWLTALFRSDTKWREKLGDAIGNKHLPYS